jgi:hypothetical protein
MGVESHLCLASFALMVRDANLVEQAVQLGDAGVDLLSQVTGVHGYLWGGGGGGSAFKVVCRPGQPSKKKVVGKLGGMQTRRGLCLVEACGCVVIACLLAVHAALAADDLAPVVQRAAGHAKRVTFAVYFLRAALHPRARLLRMLCRGGSG